MNNVHTTATYYSFADLLLSFVGTARMLIRVNVMIFKKQNRNMWNYNFLTTLAFFLTLHLEGKEVYIDMWLSKVRTRKMTFWCPSRRSTAQPISNPKRNTFEPFWRKFTCSRTKLTLIFRNEDLQFVNTKTKNKMYCWFRWDQFLERKLWRSVSVLHV